MFENSGSLSYGLQLNHAGLLHLHAALGEALERKEDLPISLQIKSMSRDESGILHVILEPITGTTGQAVTEVYNKGADAPPMEEDDAKAL